MDDDEEISALHALFSELPVEVIRFVWRKAQGDKAQCQEELGKIACSEEELAKLQAEMLAAGFSGSGGYEGLQSRSNEVHNTEAQRPAEIRMNSANSSGSLGGGDALGTLGSEGSLATIGLHLAPPPESDTSYLPALPTAWDMSSLAETVSNVSDGLTNLAANLATNITGWVHDLASAFDAGWGEDEQEEMTQQHQYDKNAPAVGIGGSVGLGGKTYHRRGAVSGGGGGSGAFGRHEAEQDEEGEGEGDFGSKDD